MDGLGPPHLPQAAAPLFSLSFTPIYTMMDFREIPCRNCSDTFDCFASCLFALLQQYGTLETSHSVASRLYPITAFPGSPPSSHMATRFGLPTARSKVYRPTIFVCP